MVERLPIMCEVLGSIPLPLIIIIVKLSWRPGKGTLGKNFAGKMFMWLIHKTGHSGATSQTVATCGGEAVCVIDCQTGIVLHKYKVPGEVSAGPSSPRLLGPGTGTLTLFLVTLFWWGWNPGSQAHSGPL